MLFREFSQLDPSISRRYGGTGLGLAICHRFAKAMGGGITVESQPGKGSTFTLRLDLEPGPVILPSAAEPAMETGRSFSGSRILLAEDNRVNQQVARGMLEKYGCQVEVVGDGLQAIAMARSAPFNLILMDCSMPEMDGFEATRQLRQSGIATPIIALTASALDDTRQACRAAGMDDFMTKPVPPGAWLPILSKWIAPVPPALE